MLLRILATLDAAALALVAVAAFGLVPFWAPVVAFAVALPSHAAAQIVRGNGHLSSGRKAKALGELAAALDRANGHEVGASNGR
jgi:hypothetical protein